MEASRSSRDKQRMENLKGNFIHPEKLYVRWLAYDYCDPAIPFQDEYLEALNLRGGESIVDIGCGDGSALFKLFKNHHQGTLTGIDPNIEPYTNPYAESPLSLLDEEMYSNFLAQTRFIEATASGFSLPDRSVDRVITAHSLYLEEDLDTALAKIKALLKEDGVHVSATSDKEHKPLHRKIETKMAAYLGIEPPDRMNATYTSAIAHTKLSNQYNYVQHIPQHTRMVIYPKDIMIYLLSLDTMQSLFKPPPVEDQWKSAIDYIMSALEPIVNSNQPIVDIVRRDFFICSDVPQPVYVPNRSLNDSETQETKIIEQLLDAA